MRALIPAIPHDISYDDLAALYEFPTPSGGRWLRANFVSTMDGAAQGPDYRSGSLSSTGDKQVFALQRSLCDAVLVGATTTRVEGYQPVKRSEIDADLRARLGLQPVPTIAVVSRSLSLDPALLAGGEAPTIVITCAAASDLARDTIPESVPVIVAGTETVDLAAAVDELGRRGLPRLLCEGGPTLLAQIVAADCLDDLCLTLAPVLVGGDRRRIQHGPDLAPPRGLALASLLQQDEDLFARYLVEKTA